METSPVTRKHQPISLRLTRFTGCLLLIAVSGRAMPAMAFQPPVEDPKARKIREATEAQDEQKKKDGLAAEEKQGGRNKAVPQPGTITTPPGGKGPQTAQPVPGGPTGVAGGGQGKPAPVSVTGGQFPPKGGGATGAAGGGGGRGGQDLKPGEVSLAAFADGLDLKALVEYVAEKLQINIIAADELSGTVVLNAPVVVKDSELIKLLDALLEQHGFTITEDAGIGFYKVTKIENVLMTFDGTLVTTKVIPTPSIRPSSLSDIISAQVGVMSGAAQPGVPGGGARGRMNFLDDLGVIIVTDSPRRIEMIEQIVNVVMARAAEQEFIRFDLVHLAASAARTRVLELVGKNSGIPGMPQVQQPGQPGVVGGQSNTNFDNLSDRLTVDPQSNALILRGYKDEEAKIKSLLAVLDRPTQAEYRQYFAGAAAQQIAQLAERFGLGGTETVETMAQSQAQPGGIVNNNNLRNQQQAGLQGLQQFGQQQTLGGPVLVVDPSRGTITYNGTSAQQDTLAKLIKAFNPELEIVEFRAYKIKNMPSPDMADLLTGLIFNQEVTRSDSSFTLPGSGGSSRRGSGGFRDNSNSSMNSRVNQGLNGSLNGQTNQSQTQNGRTQRTSGRTGGSSGGGGTGNARLQSPLAFQTGDEPPESITSISTQDVFVLADEANNQVVVKATARDHRQIAKLVEKLDQRRPQVYIDVQIVSVTASDNFRLAVEVQGINANGTGGAANVNFGLGSLTSGTGTGTAGGFLSPKNIATGLPGLTAAVIRSNYVPIVMTALKSNADTRILSSPQLLVDDNESAEIVSLDEQPTTTTNIGTATTEGGFGGFVSAGTTLSVKPSISEGGYMRLEYEIELSNFNGTGSNGIPPPRQTRNVNSYVTIPGNATIVVGGITVDSDVKTVVKVPILGDIPIIKYLFSDNSKTHQTTRLYIFITPRIMRDVNFGDPTLLTKGMAQDAGVDLGIPDLKPVMVEMNEAPPSFVIPKVKVEGKKEEDAPVKPAAVPEGEGR